MCVMDWLVHKHINQQKTNTSLTDLCQNHKILKYANNNITIRHSRNEQKKYYEIN